MPRRLRFASGGYVYRVLNRAVARATLLDQSADYAALQKVLRQAKDRLPMRLLAYCALPNHWHLIVWPRGDGYLSEFLRWQTLTHPQRWHAHRHTAGSGPLYQGRFKCFPIQTDEHLLVACRYVERNPLRAQLVRKAKEWRWSSLWHRVHASAGWLLEEGPLPLPADWRESVSRPEAEAELMTVRQSAERGAPLGEEVWQQQTAQRLGLLSTLRSRGRPRKPASQP